VSDAARAAGIKFLDRRCNDAILRGDVVTASRLGGLAQLFNLGLVT
jgi:hypothetical protein